MARGPIRLREVADAAAVNVSTASRALNRPELVRPETRARVEAAARALGYVPNRMARAIVTGRKQTLVIVVPDLALGFFTTVASGAQAETRQRKFDLLVADSAGDPDREAELVADARGYADAVILVWPQGGYVPGPEDVPVVSINRRIPGAHGVLLDQTHIVEEQFAHLRALGHERILFVDGDPGYWAARERRRAAEHLAEAATLTISPPTEPSFEGGQVIADHLDPEVTAVMAFADNQALGIIARLGERGIRVPEDVSVIGCNDVQWARLANPALTSVRTPFEAMGRAAVSLALDHEPAIEGTQIIETVRSELVVRRSTAPPRHR